MKVYATPGNATQYTPKGDGSSAQLLKSYNWYDGADLKTGLIPMEISAATEKNRAGSSRVMLKVATTMPKATVDLVSAGSVARTSKVTAMKDLRIQTHIVVECDEDLVRQSSAMNGEFSQCGAGQILADQLRALFAMVLGVESLSAATDPIPVDGTIVRGLLGLNPLDTVDGSYGKADGGGDYV